MCCEAKFPDSYISVVSGAADKAQMARQTIASLPDRIGKRARIYYISENGNDDNDGLSAEKPLTFERLCTLHLRSGDAVLFKRGSVFCVSDALYLSGGVHYGAYGTGNKPQIIGSLRNYADSRLWEKSSAYEDIWTLTLATHIAGVVTFENDRYIGVRKYKITELCSNGDYFHDTVSGVFYLYTTLGNPGECFSDIEIGTADDLIFAQNVNDIRIENITLKYASVFGINLGNNRGVEICGCELSYIGGHTFKKEIRYGNGIQFWLRCENISVTDCFFLQIYDAALTFQGSGKEEAYFENILFCRNLIEYCSMNFEYWAGNGSGTDCRIQNILFSENILRCGGYGWGGIQRPDSGNQALLLGWNRHYENFKNFVISNNIFDCADGNLIFAESPSQQHGLAVFGNSYYQRKPTGKNPFTEIIRKSGIAADGQKELEQAIRLFDSAPKMISWVE